MTLLIAPLIGVLNAWNLYPSNSMTIHHFNIYIFIYIYIYVLLLKEQNNQIIKELKEIRKIIPNKQEIQQLKLFIRK